MKIKPTNEQLIQAVQAIREEQYFMVIDLEATCTNDTMFESCFVSEIIEFGICIKTPASVDTYQIYVKPKISAVTDFCTELTGISHKKLENAPYFEGAIVQLSEILKQYPELNSWGSFGLYAKSKVISQCLLFKQENPLVGYQHFNIKDLCWAQSNTKKGQGLDAAISSRGLSFKGRHHSGVDDALNIMALVNHLSETVPIT